MKMTDDSNSEDRIVEDPSTDAYTLSIIAVRRPDLWKEVYLHPNTDPTWREEIAEKAAAAGEDVPELPAEEAPLSEEEQAEATRKALSNYLGVPVRKKGSLLKRLFGRN